MAPTYTVETALEVIKLTRNDTLAAWLTDAQYRSIMYSHVIEDSASRVFNKRAPGVYVHETGYSAGQVALLFDNETSPFTGEASLTYEVSARGTIYESTGAHSTSTITVSAALIDLGAVMKQLYFTLSSQCAIQIALSFGQVSVTPGSIAKDLREMAAQHEGIRS